MNYPNDKTKKLFKPFFELSDYLTGKLNVLGYTDYDLYLKLVDDCLSSFYGTEKLSVNRTMREYRTISIFIYKIDPNMLFSCFCKSFHDNITGNNKELFMTYILCDAISNESDFDKCINECLKAYSTITYTEKTHSDLLRLIVVLRNRKYIPDYINYNTGVNLTNRFINYLESLILLNVMQANQTQKKKRL
ncbi:TPA: hypothetical protein R6P87_002580 [Klebsiella pneumoniae]|nr:hypothetical protein [Salmonella enterica subsp. enterica serovar Bareilly]HAX7715885.1 hypothetical protein [Escherichia coli]HBW6968665.1 hypothetical protein [Klebsiella pneumoniae]HED9534056.1 hypothetical protein [Klebsiella pneumoniae]